MLSIRELEAQAKALVPVVRDYVKGAIDPILKRLQATEDRLKAVEEIELPSLNEDEVVAKLLPYIPVPKDGKDADPALIKQLIGDCIAEFPPENGRDGLDGKDGTSVEVKDLVPVIKEEVAKEFAELPVPKDGIDGRDGVDGAPGKDGADGKSVSIEEVDRMLEEKVAKAMQAVQLPQDGKPGDDGRDAIDLEILPEIDESKSYTRGTYAQHANGLWRAFERTHGMKGWECIVAGVASLEIIEGDDLRQVSVKTTLSNGVEQVKAFHFPAMVYRGIFKSGMYDPGDTVTWGGSLWHCDSPTDDKPGEVNSKGWTLAAKRGRDGKNGTNGIDKTAPVKLS